jgi:arylsulfatase A-like enzyme
MGALDVSTALLTAPHGLARLDALFPPLATATILLGLVWLATWLLLVRPVSRQLSLDGPAAAIALAAFQGLTVTIVRLGDLLPASLEPLEIFPLLIVVAVSVAGGLAAYLAARGFAGSPRIEASVAALPVWSVEVVLFQWAAIYALESVFSVAAVLLTGALLVVAAVTGALAWRLCARDLGFALPGGCAVALALASLSHTGFVETGRFRQEGAAAPVEHEIRHVILVTSDTLRADALSTYDPSAPTTAHLDALAADGVVFQRAYSPAPWTLASLASLLTGLAPPAHTVTRVDSRLPGEAITLAESLRDAGYHTGAIVLNDLLHPRANLSQGFADYLFLTEPHFGGSLGAALLRTFAGSIVPAEGWPTTDDMTDLAVAWLEENRGRDFFFWLHYYDPHAPFTPPARLVDAAAGRTPEFYDQKSVLTGLAVPSAAERDWIEQLYLAEVQYLDENVGRLVSELKRLGLYDDALIVFTSDHGEEFWEHGAHGHGHSQFNELLAVPLIVKTPGSSARGTVHARVSSESLHATILDLLSIEFDVAQFSSGSLAARLLGEPAAEPAAPVVATAQVLFDDREAVLFDRYKYSRSRIDGSDALFDLEADPGELRPSVPPEAELRARARGLLEAYHDAARSLRNRYGLAGDERVTLDDETARRLEALGYLQ